MLKLRFIGDVHGDYGSLNKLQLGADYSLALGDIGFNYYDLSQLYGKFDVNTNHHKCLFGNHENIPLVRSPNRPPYFLNDFGVKYFTKDFSVFYISGGFSIDYKLRTPGFSWFPEEELSDYELNQMIQYYSDIKPKIVCSHEGPFNCVEHVTDPRFAKVFGYNATIQTRTSMALQRALDNFNCDTWLFAHYHVQGGKQFKIKNCTTNFIHLDQIRTNPKTGFIYDGSWYDMEI